MKCAATTAKMITLVENDKFSPFKIIYSHDRLVDIRTDT